MSVDNDDGFRTKRMENAYYWAAQADGWMTDGPNAGLEDRYYVEVIGGRPVLVLDESFTDSTTKAILDSLREYGFPTPIDVRELDDETRLFIREPSDDRLKSNYDDDWRDYDVTGGFK